MGKYTAGLGAVPSTTRRSMSPGLEFKFGGGGARCSGVTPSITETDLERREPTGVRKASKTQYAAGVVLVAKGGHRPPTDRWVWGSWGPNPLWGPPRAFTCPTPYPTSLGPCKTRLIRGVCSSSVWSAQAPSHGHCTGRPLCTPAVTPHVPAVHCTDIGKRGNMRPPAREACHRLRNHRC